MKMMKFKDHLHGSWGHSFKLTTLPDGRVKVTTDNQTFKDKEWFGNSQEEAMTLAKSELHDAALTGEL